MNTGKTQTSIKRHFLRWLFVTSICLVTMGLYICYTYEVHIGMPAKYKETLVEDLFHVNLDIKEGTKQTKAALVVDKWFPIGCELKDALKPLNDANFQLAMLNQKNNETVILVFKKKVQTLFISRYGFTIVLTVKENLIVTCDVTAVVFP